jgi:beta-N-acetylhexosaminidase
MDYESRRAFMRDLRALAGATLCVGFPGDVASPTLLDELRDLGPCGVVLFARNVSTRAGTSDLVAAVSHALTDRDAREPLVCVDQEGGRVARLRFSDVVPAMLALAAADDVELARRAGVRLGRDLAQIGANVDFAPVLDLALAPGATAIGTRALGDDPARAARLGAALVRGLQSTGVAATVKHFPGHGESDLDPHVAFPVRDAIAARDLMPFEAAVEAGALAAMSAHVVVREHGTLPATLTRAILTDLLRDRLGFSGVLFTDCLQMDAIARGVGTARGAVLALAAGADVLLVSHDLAIAREARDAIVAAVESGEVPRARLEAAVARTDTLRAQLASLRLRREAVAKEEDDGIAAEIARASIVRVRGEARLDAERPIAIVSFEGVIADGIASTAAERPSLSLALRRRRFRSEYFRVPANPDATMREMLLEVLGAQRVHGERTLAIVARRAHLHPEQRELIGALLAIEPDAIGISALEPFDVPVFAVAKTVYATCGDDELAIEALAGVLAGRAQAHGTLPIDLATHV